LKIRFPEPLRIPEPDSPPVSRKTDIGGSVTADISDQPRIPDTNQNSVPEPKPTRPPEPELDEAVPPPRKRPDDDDDDHADKDDPKKDQDGEDGGTQDHGTDTGRQEAGQAKGTDDVTTLERDRSRGDSDADGSHDRSVNSDQLSRTDSIENSDTSDQRETTAVNEGQPAGTSQTHRTSLIDSDVPENHEPPGRVPPSQPNLGDTDNGPGSWESKSRKETGAAYQEQISGVPRNSDGSAIEYVVKYDPDPGRRPEIEFDGHGWRGQPPQEIYLEAKSGYQAQIVEDVYPDARKGILEEMEDQAKRQLNAIRQNSPGATLEWHFSNQQAAEIVQKRFARNDNLEDVIIIYTPAL
jgi:hypothetical protein